MTPNLAMVGVSHRTAPLVVRERYHVASETARHFTEELLAAGPAGREALVISTCNRTEVYVADPPTGGDAPPPNGSEPAPPREPHESGGSVASIRALLARTAGIPVEEARGHLETRTGTNAVRHLFRVTAGLESMVPGETQIQGQVRETYERALEAEPRSVGPILCRLFEATLATAARARNETGMDAGAVSIPGAALLLARKVFGSVAGRRALVVGAGEMSESAAWKLGHAGADPLLVANRSPDRSAELAGRVNGTAIPFPEWHQHLRELDVVVSATAAPHPVLRAKAVREARTGRGAPSLLIVDLAVPRDVEAAVGGFPGVFLYTVDDLRGIVQDSLARRLSAQPEAEAVIEQGVRDFSEWYASRRATPVIRALREDVEEVRQRELDQALAKLGHLAPEDRRLVERLSRRIVNKVLHPPTVQLRRAATNGRGAAVLESARYLFGLEHATEGPARSPAPSAPQQSDEPSGGDASP